MLVKLSPSPDTHQALPLPTHPGGRPEVTPSPWQAGRLPRPGCTSKRPYRAAQPLPRWHPRPASRPLHPPCTGWEKYKCTPSCVVPAVGHKLEQRQAEAVHVGLGGDRREVPQRAAHGGQHTQLRSWPTSLAMPKSASFTPSSSSRRMFSALMS
jgi:hypothetical protein